MNIFFLLSCNSRNQFRCSFELEEDFVGDCRPKNYWAPNGENIQFDSRRLGRLLLRDDSFVFFICCFPYLRSFTFNLRESLFLASRRLMHWQLVCGRCGYCVFLPQSAVARGSPKSWQIKATGIQIQSLFGFVRDRRRRFQITHILFRSFRFFVLFTLFYYELFQFTVKHAVRSVYGADYNISNWSNWVRMNSNKSWDCRLFSIRYEPNMPSSTLVASFTNANHKQNANSINYLLINSVMRLNFGAKCISLINNML